MAAGLGFKDFVTGEVLTAADVDGYLMQGIWVFASAAARDAAVTSPQEGNFAFTKDNNSLWYYDGAAWVASGATGDIEGVTAGIGISGGGTSGTVTVTNSMATAIDAKGDLVAGTGADTFAKLTVGANNTVLTADSAEATGLKWATPAAGGMTLLSTTTLSGASTTISSISGSYTNLFVTIYNVNLTASSGALRCYPNNNSTENTYVIHSGATGTTYQANGQSATFALLNPANSIAQTNANNFWSMTFYDYAATDHKKSYEFCGMYEGFAFPTYNQNAVKGAGAVYNSDSAITSLVFAPSSGTFNSGTVKVYGVK